MVAPGSESGLTPNERKRPMNAWNADMSSPDPSPTDILASPDPGNAVSLDNATQRGVFGFNSQDRRSRPFNLLRSQMMKIANANDWKIIGVTSATPGVGKTFIASNLAASMSRIPNLHTLLFDLDLRRGSVATQFGLPDGLGIDAYLAGEIDSLDMVARNIIGHGLTIFPTFPTGAHSAELLAGTRMAALVAAMRGLGDNCVCLCDLPPAFANDDASIMLQKIDAYLLVVEEGHTTGRQVREAIEVLKPAPCIGTVLNRYHGMIGGDDYGFGYWSQGKYDAYYN